jgi:hypothetical protein
MEQSCRRRQGKKREESTTTVSSTRQTSGSVASTVNWMDVSRNNFSRIGGVHRKLDGRKQKQFQSTTKLPFSSLSEDYVILLSRTLYLLFRTFASKSPSRMAEMLRVKVGLNSEYSPIQAKTRRFPPFCVDLGHKVYAEVISRSKC